jgi:hypothetical protein
MRTYYSAITYQKISDDPNLLRREFHKQMDALHQSPFNRGTPGIPAGKSPSASHPNPSNTLNCFQPPAHLRAFTGPLKNIVSFHVKITRLI